MIRKLLVNSLLALLILTGYSCKNKKYLSLHPDNPHYFLFRGKPAVLIGSTEHYGAVMNLDFDYIQYLDELKDKGLNVTRTFSGVYVEPMGAFKIKGNTLAPETGRFICPWKRSNQPGYANGGNKFDLDQWDEAYFERLRDFVSEAGKRDIVVELDLFSNYYDTIQWKLCPLYSGNNINNVGNFQDHKEVLALKHPDILAVQEKMVRKIVGSLINFDNLYYEVCNEPYFGDLEALKKWEEHMTEIISDAEKDFTQKHLVSQNISNGSKKIDNPSPLVSIFNFHYSKPPGSVAMNYDLNRVIGDNETGFKGIEDVHYRTEAWGFMIAGGSLYNNLDYSFTAENENGTFVVTEGQPGGGGKNLRKQLQILKNVLEDADLTKMMPLNQVVMNDTVPGLRVLADPGKYYIIYIDKTAVKPLRPEGRISFPVELPDGKYDCSWINTVTGDRSAFSINAYKGGVFTVSESPSFSEDIALIIKKRRIF
jgi:hypothetical protein